MKRKFNISPFESQALAHLAAEEKKLEEVKEISSEGLLPLAEIIALCNTENTTQLPLTQVADPILYKGNKLKITQYEYLLFERECHSKNFNYSNILQGKLKNCWFLAATGAILLHPRGIFFIASMMRDLSQLIEIEIYSETKKISSVKPLPTLTKPKAGMKLFSTYFSNSSETMGLYKKTLSLGKLLGLPEGILVRLFKDNVPHYIIVKKSIIPEIYNHSNFYIKILEKAYLTLFSSSGDLSCIEYGIASNAFTAFSATSSRKREIIFNHSADKLEKDLEKILALESPFDIHDQSILKKLRPITIRFCPVKIEEYNSKRSQDPELKLVAQHTYFMSHLATLVSKLDESSRTVAFLINPWDHSGVTEIFDEKTKEFTLINSPDRVSMMSMESLLALGSYITIADDFEVSSAFSENLSKKSIKYLHSLLHPIPITKSEVSKDPPSPNI